ncbi:hypothetical protein [Corynebacterium kalinowskii]|nr:hypothetical protein [Corynebacterium kalinowskii]
MKGGKGKGKGKGGKGTESAKNLYDEAVEALRNAAGGDWNGPAHPPERIHDALDSTKGIDTDALRDKTRDIANGGRPEGMKSKDILRKISLALAGLVGGLVAETVLEKAYEWWRSDRDSQEFGSEVTEGADKIDEAEDSTCAIAENLCSSTNSQVKQLCLLLGLIDKSENPDQYRDVLCAADSLVNECGNAVIGLAQDRDRCLSDIYNAIIQRGAEICGEKVSDIPAACDAPTAPAGVSTPPAASPATPPATPCASEPASAAPVVPASAPPAPIKSVLEPASACDKPEPVKTVPAAATPPEAKQPDLKLPGVKQPEVELPERQAPCPEPEHKCETSAQDVEPTKVEPAESECVEEAPKPECPESGGSSIASVLGIGIAIAVIGALVMAAEEFLSAPPEPPVPEPAPNPVPEPEPAAAEPPPPPKQNVPEPPPPPKQNVPEPPPPPKQNVPEPPPPPKQNVPEPPPAPAPEPAPIPEPAHPEKELVGSGIARKAGAW